MPPGCPESLPYQDQGQVLPAEKTLCSLELVWGGLDAHFLNKRLPCIRRQRPGQKKMGTHRPQLPPTRKVLGTKIFPPGPSEERAVWVLSSAINELSDSGMFLPFLLLKNRKNHLYQPWLLCRLIKCGTHIKCQPPGRPELAVVLHTLVWGPPAPRNQP